MTVATKPKRRVRKKKKEKISAEQQHADFVKAARALEADETGAEFDRAFRKIIQSKPIKKRT